MRHLNWLLASSCVIAIAAPGIACATAKVRVEFVRMTTDYTWGQVSNTPQFVYASQTLTVSGSPVSSTPPAAAESLATARLVGVTGSAICTIDGTTPTELNGSRVDAGHRVDVGIRSGVAVSCVEAADGGPATGGDASAANQTTQITDLGGLTETAPATDTASSGLNGRLQRLAQRFTSLIGQFPSSLGIKTAANSFSVAPASDAAFQISAFQGEATSCSGILTSGATAQDLFAAGTPVHGWSFQNQSAGNLYLRSKGAGGGSLATQDQNSLLIAPGAYFEAPFVSPNAYSVIGPTTAQAFFCRTW